MATPPNDAHGSSIAQEVDAWLRTAREQQARLHLLAASPYNSNERQEAFTLMSALLCQAFEEVRILSKSTREWSQTARSNSTDLRADCSRLKAQCAKEMDRMAQFAGPSPEAIREAESRTLKMFKDGRK